MSDLFESHTKRSVDPKIVLIGAAALVVIVAVAIGAYFYSIPTGPTDDEVLGVDVREQVVTLLDHPRFSGDEFRSQVLGRGRFENYKKVIDEAIFSYPKAGETEIQDFVAKYFWDAKKVEFGTIKNGEIWLGDYHIAASENYGYLFRTNMANIHIEPRQTLNFQFRDVTYSPTLEEIKNLTNDSQVFGGRVYTQVPERSFTPTMVFANHAIMVAKAGEPSLKRLADDLLRNVPQTREARIQRLVDFVSNEIEYSYAEAFGRGETLKRGDETLMTRSGDCSNKTILLASLLEQIGEEYLILYCPRHITVAVLQGDFANENKLDFTWDSRQWLIAETTLPGFQVGKTKVAQFEQLMTIQYVQSPKNTDIIYDANSYEVLKFL